MKHKTNYDTKTGKEYSCVENRKGQIKDAENFTKTEIIIRRK